MGDPLSPFDSILGISKGPPAEDAETISILRVEWPWLRPLQAILATSGWTIHDVVNRPSVATELRYHWKIYRANERQVKLRALSLARDEPELPL